MNDEMHKRVLDDLDFVTDRLSTQTRQVSFGVIAVVWALMVGDPAKKITIDRHWLLVAAALSIAAVVSDLLQYLAAYFASQRARKSLAAGADKPFDPHWFSYRLRSGLFFVKIAIALCAASVLLFLISSAIFHGVAG